MITDTHVHLVYRDQLAYDWIEPGSYLDADVSVEQYEQVARQVGITKALHMEVDVAEADMEKETTLIESLIARDDTILCGAIAACRPEHKDFDAYLERQSSRPAVKGFRRVLHVMPDEHSQQPVFRDGIKQLAQTSWVFDLCALPRQLPVVTELVDLVPNLQFVMDHCGVPDIKAGEFSRWAAAVAQLALRDNVVAKLSGIIAYGDGTRWRVDTLKPYVHHVIECFGTDRVVWGSDSPVCLAGGSISDWVAATHALLSDLNDAERHAILSANAARVWRL